MTVPLSPDASGTSTRPYLIRALHDWCTDNGFTPYLAVFVDGSVQVPMEYVKNHEIVLNVGFEATSGLKLGNEFIEFRARFGGVARDIVVPVDHVVAIYARENGQGMAFPVPSDVGSGTLPGTLSPVPAPGGPGEPGVAGGDGGRAGGRAATAESGTPPAPRPAPVLRLAGSEPPAKPDDEPTPPAPGGGRPALKRVK